LQRDAAAMLGWRRLLAIGSNRDVAQATPFQATPLAFLDGEGRREASLAAVQPRLISPARTGFSAAEYCTGLWSGSIRDEYAVETVVSTAAMALMALSPSPLDYANAREEARQLWTGRREISS
jgi:anthranilate phosphoribosyltransferase